MPDRVALYPGSFDPVTRGHLDLIQRAARIFPRIIVAVATNNAKSCLFTVDERLEMLRSHTRDFSNVEVAHFRGLTVDFARKVGAVAIIRGLRVISDFEYELSMAINNEKMNPNVDTVLLTPSEPYLYLSSRLVKEIASYGGPLDHYVTPEVGAMLHERLG